MVVTNCWKRVQRKDCTTGNHAQALAYHGGQLNIPVTVVMPIVAPIMKVWRGRQRGRDKIIIHLQRVLSTILQVLYLLQLKIKAAFCGCPRMVKNGAEEGL